MKPFFISVPHSGEVVPREARWLDGLPEPILMCDVDRYVDRLYQDITKDLNIPFVVTEWHRYVIDLNRLEDDVDSDSVEGHKNPSGKFTTGLHWVKTTKGDTLMKKPISLEEHNILVKNYFYPFHEAVKARYAQIKEGGHKKVYHLDAHSMPSVGTAAHRDPGAKRPDIVVSDSDGKSTEAKFKDLVISAYEQAGFKVGYNWPYKGGRVTETYGKPSLGQHALQVELNRALYMDEDSKQMVPGLFLETKKKIEKAIHFIYHQL